MKAFDRIFGLATADTVAKSLPGYEAAPGRDADHQLLMATVNRVRTAGARLSVAGAVVGALVMTGVIVQHPSQMVTDPLMVVMLNIMLLVGPAIAAWYAVNLVAILVVERLRVATETLGVIVKSARPRLP